MAWLLCLMAAAFVMAGGAPAVACGIDGIPSMALNGRLVTINHGPATKDNIPYWAAFLLGTAQRGAVLRFAENASELHNSLTAAAFATPFQWTFGDGATARGLAVSHRYAQPGWYKVNVSYYYTPQKRWVTFDSAQLRIPGAASAREESMFSAPLIWAGGVGMIGAAALVLALVPWRRNAEAARRSRQGPRGKPPTRARGR